MANFRLSLTPRKTVKKKADDSPISASSKSPPVIAIKLEFQADAAESSQANPDTPSPPTPNTSPRPKARAALSPLRTNPASPRPIAPPTSKVTLGPTVLRTNLAPRGGEATKPRKDTGRAVVDGRGGALARVPTAVQPQASMQDVVPNGGTPTLTLPTQTLTQSSLQASTPAALPPPKAIAFKVPQLRISLPLAPPSLGSATSTPSTPGSAFSPCSFYTRSPFSYTSSVFAGPGNSPVEAPAPSVEMAEGEDGRLEADRGGMAGSSAGGGSEKEVGKNASAIGPLTARVTRRL